MWSQRSVCAVGGLTEVGWARVGSLILIVSHQGRGVVNASTGELVARESDEDSSTWFDASGPRALGIGPVDGWIDVAGLSGGELVAHWNGWTAQRADGGLDLSRTSGELERIVEPEELRAFGFDPSGLLAIATPSDLTIYEWQS